MSNKEIFDSNNIILPKYLPTPQHLNWVGTQIYQNSQFPPVASAPPNPVNPVSILLPADIQANELIGIAVVVYRGVGGSWTANTDTIQFEAQQFDGTGVFSNEICSGVFSYVPQTDGAMENYFGISTNVCQQRFFYFSTLPFTVQNRNLLLWSTGTPTAGTGGGIEVYLYRQQ